MAIEAPSTTPLDFPAFSQTVALEPLGAFRVIAWVKTAGIAGADQFPGASINLTFLDANRQAIGSANSSSLKGDNAWSRVSVTLDRIPANTRSVMVRLALRGYGSAWFDSVSASQAVPLAQLLSSATLSLSDRVLQSRFLGFGVQHNPWYGAANPLVTDDDIALTEARVAALQPRLLGTFFSTRWWEIAGWSSDEAANTTAIRVTDVAHDGGASLHIQGSTPGAALDFRGVSQTLIPAPVGAVIRVGTWIRTRALVGPAAESPGASLVINYQGSDARGFAANYSQQVSGDTDWTFVTASGTVPPGTTAIRISLLLHGYGEAWFDSATMTLSGAGAALALENPGFEVGMSFDTERMRALLRVLSLYQRVGADINLRMYWPYDWAVADFPVLVARVRDLLDYLIRAQGLSRIRYLTLYPEPELFLPHPIEAYFQVYRLMSDTLRSDGLSVQLVGADECCSDGYFHAVVPALASIVGEFSYHGGPDYRDATGLVLRARDRVAYVAAVGAGKPTVIWEFNVTGEPGDPSMPGKTTSGANVLDTFDGALGLVRGSLAAMNEGIAGMSYFELNDMRVGPGGDVPHWGLWAGKDAAWRQRPVYYAYGLLTRLTQSGAAVLDVPFASCDRSLPTTAVRNPDGTQTVYVVNPWQSAVDLTLTGLPSTWTPKRYLLTEAETNRLTAANAPFAYGYAAAVGASGEIVDRLPARSIVAYSDVATADLPAPPPAPCDMTSAPTTTAYLPNITKTLGGPTGFVTPFIVQNVGTTPTDLEVSFYRFSNGSSVTCRKITGLAAGTSFADVPNNDSDLPPDSQFSVVVRSYGAPIVSVVNEHAGTGERAEALSYNGFTSGSTTVFLPNIVRRFFGYHTPFIIQNLGTASTVATATFVGRGSEPTATITRTIAAGQSQFIEPNIEPGLIDGGAYAVTVRAGQPLAVVVNTHNDDASVARPVAYATDGIPAGASTVYGPYAAKDANNSGRAGTTSTIVVQNLGTTATSPSLEFTPLGGGATKRFDGPSLVPGGAWAFDPRWFNGLAGAGSDLCGSHGGLPCLDDGEYTFKVSAAGTIAAAVNVISPDSAMGYTATGSPATKYFLPNVTRTLGGSSGWTTPVLLLSVSATGASVEWRRFADGGLVTTQTLTLTPGSGVRIDPRAVAGLTDDTQYALTVTATGGLVAAIVEELASGGDSAMIYEGFGQ